MAAVTRVFESQYFILGPEVKLFEEEVAAKLRARFAVGCASGADALVLSLMVAGMGPGAFYTNPDGAAARKTTAVVLLFLACFYVFPAIFAALGRLDAPQLYATGQTDSVVLVLPRLVAGGAPGAALAALTAGGAFAAFLSTSSGLLISMSGALSHDLMGKGVRAFRTCASASGSLPPRAAWWSLGTRSTCSSGGPLQSPPRRCAHFSCSGFGGPGSLGKVPSRASYWAAERLLSPS